MTVRDLPEGGAYDGNDSPAARAHQQRQYARKAPLSLQGS